MAKVTMFALCDSVNNVQGPQGRMLTTLVEPRVVLRPLYIPGNFSFGVTVGVCGVDLDKPASILVKILGPDGDTAYQLGELTVPASGGDSTLPRAYHGFMFNMDIRNMPVKAEGTYKFVLTVNGEDLEAQEIPIFRGVADDAHN